MSSSLQHPQARIAGVIYLLFFVTAFASIGLLSGIVVAGDAAATAHHIIERETVYRAAVAVNLIANALYLALTALLFRLLAPVNRILSLLAAFFGLAGCCIQIFGGVFQLAPLVILKDAQLAALFSVAQLQGAALVSLKLYTQTFYLSLVLFAVYDLVLGYLVFTSGFLPRTLGTILMCAGAGWMAFTWPPLATALSAVILPFGALAELLLMAWLLIRGVNVTVWQEKAARELH